MTLIRGSCLCGGIEFEITGPLLRPGNCHCSMCRKQHGAAFRSRVRVRKEDFRWVEGEKLVKFYQSSPGFRRGFCGVCGSPILNKYDAQTRTAQLHPGAVSEYGIALATLDDDPGVRPQFNYFVASKAPWFDITDGLPQYDEYGPPD
jgi:hypothetical protein